MEEINGIYFSHFFLLRLQTQYSKQFKYYCGAFVIAPLFSLRFRNTCIDCVWQREANSPDDIYNCYKSIYGSYHKKQPGSNRKTCKSGNILSTIPLPRPSHTLLPYFKSTHLLAQTF